MVYTKIVNNINLLFYLAQTAAILDFATILEILCLHNVCEQEDSSPLGYSTYVQYVIFRYFLSTISDFTHKHYNLTIKNSFNPFLSHGNI